MSIFLADAMQEKHGSQKENRLKYLNFFLSVSLFEMLKIVRVFISTVLKMRVVVLFQNY